MGGCLGAHRSPDSSIWTRELAAIIADYAKPHLNTWRHMDETQLYENQWTLSPDGHLATMKAGDLYRSDVLIATVPIGTPSRWAVKICDWDGPRSSVSFSLATSQYFSISAMFEISQREFVAEFSTTRANQANQAGVLFHAWIRGTGSARPGLSLPYQDGSEHLWFAARSGRPRPSLEHVPPSDEQPPQD